MNGDFWNNVWRWLLDRDPSQFASRENQYPDLMYWGRDHAGLLLGLLVGLAVLVWLTIRSYRREGEAPRWVKVGLAGLRILAFVIAFVMLLRPVLVTKRSRTFFSEVIFVVDDSESMAFTDVYEPDEKKALTAYLMKVARDRAAAAATTTAPARVPEPVDVEKLTRDEILRRAVLHNDGLIAKLAKDHPITFVRFAPSRGEETGEYIEVLGRINLVDRGPLADNAKAVKELNDIFRDKLTAAGEETKVQVAIQQTLQEFRGRQASIIVLSDGRNTRLIERPTDKELRENEQGVLIHAVLVGSTKEIRKPMFIGVSELSASEDRIIRGAQMTFLADIEYRNTRSDRVGIVKLMMSPEGKDTWVEVARSDPATLPRPTDEQYRRNEVLRLAGVPIRYTPDVTGRYVFKAVIDIASGEYSTLLNTRKVRIVDDKIKVLLVSGDAGWEFQYLRNMLLRQPDLFLVSVWQQNADPEINQDASTSVEGEKFKLKRLPRNMKELLGTPGVPERLENGQPNPDYWPGYNVVILYDPTPTKNGFDQDFARMLERFVYEQKGGLCYIVSNKNTDSDKSVMNLFYVDPKPGDSQPPKIYPLRNMLPVEVAPNTRDVRWRIAGRQPEAWKIRPTKYGVDHSVMRLADTIEANAERWATLPGIYWSQAVHRIKPGARVLGVHTNPLRVTATNEPEPLIVFQQYGLGRVLYLGTDETWRWRFSADGRYHRRFWSNAIRFLATLKPRLVDITLPDGRTQVRRGEKVRIQARAHDADYNPLTKPEFRVEVYDLATGELVESPVLKAVKDDPGKYVGQFYPKKTGEFRITAESGDEKAGEKVADKNIRVLPPPPKPEELNRQADDTHLNAVATTRKLTPVWRIDELAEVIPVGRREEELPPNIVDVWDCKLVLLGVVLLLAVEWIGRKSYNMA